MVIAEEIRQMEGEVHVPLQEVELVHFDRNGITLGLPAARTHTETEGRVELIAQGEGSSRREQILEHRLTDRVGYATLDLTVPVGIELHGGIRLALLGKRHLGTQGKHEKQC